MAELFTTGLLKDVSSLHSKADAALAELRSIASIIEKNLPVVHPAPPTDESLAILAGITTRLDALESKMNAIGLAVENTDKIVSQLLVIK